MVLSSEHRKFYFTQIHLKKHKVQEIIAVVEVGKWNKKGNLEIALFYA